MMVKVYRYGLLPPLDGAERIADQMARAHRYQNQLIEIERARRVAVRAVMGTHGDVETAAATVAALDAQRTRLRAEVQSSKAEHRTRAVPPALKDAIGAATIALTAARADLKRAKQTATTDPAVVAALAQVTADFAARLRAARAACGLYWGSYLIVEQAHDAARKAVLDPHFRRWTGDGAVGVQLQGGLTVTDAVDGTDLRFQIQTALVPVPGRSGKPRPIVALRIGSTEPARAPVWGRWPLIYHRPLPADGVVKTAKVVRRRVAAHDEWSLHVTVETETIDAPAATREVAVDLGWRQADDTLRAGGWADDAVETHDIFVDPHVIGTLTKVDDLRSIRDQHLNVLRSQLLDWREQVAALPADHAEQLKFLPQWTSPARFAALAIWWRDHRIDGDAILLGRPEDRDDPTRDAVQRYGVLEAAAAGQTPVAVGGPCAPEGARPPAGAVPHPRGAAGHPVRDAGDRAARLARSGGNPRAGIRAGLESEGAQPAVRDGAVGTTRRPGECLPGAGPDDRHCRPGWSRHDAARRLSRAARRDGNPGRRSQQSLQGVSGKSDRETRADRGIRGGARDGCAK